jgi:hypothetical protein
MKHSKAIDAATIARLLSHEDEHGMGCVFMYAFVNEVIRQNRPFSFDCDSAQIIDVPVLSVVDKEGRSITINHKRNRLSLILDDKRPDAVNQIIFKGKEYRLAMLAWLTACIQYTSLQPELRDELSEYAMSIQRGKIGLTMRCLLNLEAIGCVTLSFLEGNSIPIKKWKGQKRL